MKPIAQAQTDTATCKNNKGLCAVKLLILLSVLLERHSLQSKSGLLHFHPSECLPVDKPCES